MDRQSRDYSDMRDRKIAELEERLNNANQTIGHLQQQNIELQQYINTLVNQTNQQNSPAINTQLQTQIPPNRKTSSYRKTIRKSRFSQLSEWQFYGLTSLVVIVILALFITMSRVLFANRGNNPNVKNNQQSSSPIKPQKSANSLPNINLPNNNISTPSTTIEINKTPSYPINQGNKSTDNYPEITYNVTNPPNLNQSKELDKIVQELTKTAKNRNLPVETLSITLIDVNKQTISSYKQKTLRYPASVAKLFWMVILEAQRQQGIITSDIYGDIDNNLNKMILKSDNNATSEIIDQISHAQSLSNKLEKEGFKDWKQRRESMNRFFQKAGYQDINISQKTFPIPKLNINAPQGTDLQIRGNNPEKPIRNKISTYHAARLMYEIVTQQAVTPEYSRKMFSLLARDLRRSAWKLDPPNPDEFNPVENFLGEGLADKSVIFASKAGWTTSSRQEVAYISTVDGKNRYILAIFGDDPAYGKSKTIFPQMSQLVFERMTNSNR